MPFPINGNGERGSRRQLITALVFLILALVVAYLPSSPQQQLASALRASLLRPFVVTQISLTHARDRAEKAAALIADLDSLTTVVQNQSGLREENRRLRALLSLSGRLGTPYRAATVVRYADPPAESQFLVDIGEEEGVRPNAPVLVAGGLVGVIKEVRPRSAIGLDWTHPDFRASAMTEDGTVYGVIEPRRGSFRDGDFLVLNGTPYHTELAEGDLVVTSGLGGMYPRGIPIGTVVTLEEQEAGWRKSYLVEPIIRPGEVTHVLVAIRRRQAAGSDLTWVWDPAVVDSFATLVEEFGDPPGGDVVQEPEDVPVGGEARTRGDPGDGRP